MEIYCVVRDGKLSLRGGTAAWLKAGMETEKMTGELALKAGIWRNITLNDMPGMRLSDNWKARHYRAEKADSYTASVGIEGKVADKLHAQAKVNSTFGGYFGSDFEGSMGIRYYF